MYLKLEDEVARKYTLYELKVDYPNISFPKNPSDAVLAEYNIYPYTRPDVPTYDLVTQDLVDGVFTQDDDGNWSLPYVVQNKPQDEAEKGARVKRNRLLGDTDFYALSDVTLTPEMQTYRQALRDVTSHDNWPFLNESDWPEKP